MPNRLAGEKSPYLLQHKDNPVDWRPWGPEAFKAARDAGKPLLLSVGYSTCHWCHVMERESFSDPKVAELMNREFVCVKLDREERPDVDKVYMTAVQAMSRQGGWPLNVFLTPELKPFFGGTYYPPQARWGQPGWPDLLARIAELWRTRRVDIEKDAARLSAEVMGLVAAQEDDRRRPAAAALERARDAYLGAFDPDYCGFGGAPKFPSPSNQRFLLRRAARTGDAEARSAAVETLRAMARGGIFDQVGGGFHRYSTDAQWRVPHFEKMLYDNAQLLENLADAVLLTRDAELERALRRTVAYLARDLRSVQGGFYSAEDADSLPPELAGKADDASHEHKKEGAFYLWTAAELDAALGADAAAFKARYGVQDDGNAVHDPHGEFAGRNILFDKLPDAMSEDAAAKVRETLLGIRAARPRPGLDDKILASWNGLALSGLSRAYVATGDAAILTLATDAAEFLRRELASKDGKRLWRRWRLADRSVPGFADDYACVAAGLLDLYEAGLDPRWLAWSLELTEEALTLFGADWGGLYQTADGDAPELFARALDDHDGVEPAASSVLAETALRLHALTGRADLRKFADDTLQRFGPRLEERPLIMPYLLGVLDRVLGVSRTLVVAGTDLPGGAELLAAARDGLRPSLILAGYARKDKAALAALLPVVAVMKDGPRAAAYVCADGVCGLPLASPDALTKSLDA